ncbi:transglycosylase domain-containing protein [Massilibacteroides vaginae]|uniref:transglycosylase domain-containing protein n=1 Tax=Massilibacteroides vaginae TaxID=1673718 RepID=UPI000A1C8508|nr:transglycosylase domain-containing protein [Massilibacteroides vaginae]
MAFKWTKHILVICWIVFAVGLGIVVMVFVAIAKGSIGYVPEVEQFENPIDKYASQIISSDARLLGSYASAKDNRIGVTYNDLSPALVKALVATEDVRFAQHSGIDVQGLFRAVVKRGILMQKSGGGGSTITQQLAKQLYSPSADNILERLLQKPIEWVIAVQLERFYTKEEILTMYLDKFDFLYNAVGIQSASRVYFDATPKTLKIEEAATLVGMCKNPSYYNAKRFNERSVGRRNTVLKQMEKAGYLTTAECDSLTQLPLVVRFNSVDHKEGPAPYFREYLRMVMTAKKPDRKNYMAWQMQRFSEDSLAWATDPLYGWCNKNKKSNGDNYNIYFDGLKIYTTIDSRMQRYAEESLEQHMKTDIQPAFNREKSGRSYAPFSRSVSLGQVDTMMTNAMKQTDRYRGMKKGGMNDEEIKKEFKKPVDMRVFSWGGAIDTLMSPWDSIRYHKSILRSSFMSMDAHTGHVKAYVGGIDYKYFQYDMVSTGRRQVGSTIKPFLYSLAMIEGISPCDKMLHVPQRLIDENGKPWEPKNSTKENEGEMVSIEWGLQKSSNWVTAYLMKQLSPYTFVRLLHSFGLKTKIDPVVAVCLGTPDVSVSEMVSGYSVFPNKGIRVEPLFVTRIEDSFGNTIANFTPHFNEVLTEDASYKMLHMMRKVMDGGTGSRVRFRYGIKAPMGGKTGTSQNHSDGWFMAFTPRLVSGCWVGGEDRSIHFDRISEGQGAAMALPIYGLFMQKVYADKTLGYTEDEAFEIPEAYANPCARTNENVRQYVPTDTGGIDKMFD